MDRQKRGALLISYLHPAADEPSSEWLGHHSDRGKVLRSGLWYNVHVDKTHDPSFLDDMKSLIDTTPY